MKKLLNITAICLLAVLAVTCVKDKQPEVPTVEQSESPIVINECYSRGKEGELPKITTAIPDLDYVELYNPLNTPIDISGYMLSDQDNRSAYKIVPNGTTIAAHGFYVVVVDDGGFGLSSGGDQVYLDDAEGKQVDYTSFGAMASNESWSRNPDGTGEFTLQSLTPGASNNNAVVQPSITNVTRTPQSPTELDSVVISATITTAEGTITTVTLNWSLDSVAQTAITMTPGSNNVYSATIPKQAIGVKVVYAIVAANSVGGQTTDQGNYTVRNSADTRDYTALRVNEISGEHKYVEIYNSGAEAINLEGVKLQRNGGPTGGSEWVGTASDVIPAGAYRLFLFNSYTPNASAYSGTSTLVDKSTNLSTYAEYLGTVSSGISDQQILKVAIVAPNGTEVSVFIRGDDPLPAWGTSTSVTRVQTHSYSRMADGTWAYAVPTPGAANGAKVNDILTPGYLTADPSAIDYTALRVNEVSGEHKYVEIYNSGAEAINLEGVKLQRNGGPTGGSEWVGTASDVIPAGAYRLFLFNSYTPNATAYSGTSTLVDKSTNLSTYAEYLGTVSSGISDQQILKVAIVAKDGTEVSVFIRGDDPLPAWGTSTSVTRVQTHSYSRMADGTWAYAVPTPGAANGAKVNDILTPGYLTAQP